MSISRAALSIRSAGLKLDLIRTSPVYLAGSPNANFKGFGISNIRSFGATARVTQNNAKNDQVKHTTETYFKDVDTRPPADPKTHQVDANASDIQRPHEPPKGTHATMSKENPFEPPVESHDQKEERLRYGGVDTDAKKDTSKSNEGPADKEAYGRKPEEQQ